ncbi:CamS family sex pheromone protein [Salibacterium salarium]|uniref:CamS family sex pheromone protein n=1 Tax=Salibacterium salarium TaxID=284579 RepID=A0A3R9QM52_9BACI|nr:CamS family sex pheromone protein [Salibacterium salarium]RSL33887.1 CamS family sex pheromone protein [Salibacterium salarium]
MWRKTGILVMSSFIVLAGCIPGVAPEEDGVDIEQEEETTEDSTVEVSPEIPSLNNYYRSVLQDGRYISGAAREFHRDVVYNRMDLERIEVGMQELASEQFNQEDYFFREGQFIGGTELNNWVMRRDEDDNPLGLNPPLAEGETFEERESSQPRVLSNIIEHNYVVENNEGNLQVGGIVIGLSMNSLYYFREENDDGTYEAWLDEEIDKETSLEEATDIASQIVDRLRSEDRDNGALENVPIMFAVYREAPRDSSLPGNFIATGTAAPGEDVSNWDNLNETHYLFPSSTANEEQREDSEAFNQFRDEVNQFFENFIGVVGEGYYQNGEMRELSIEIPITFYSETEVIAFTQHVTDKVEQRFQDISVEVEITSSNGAEALIVKEPGEDPFVHVY